MILKTLTLRNFRKFKQTIIEFPDGTIGIVGLNGAGKSTIFEAIAWVLYGPVAARTSADQIKRNGAEPSDPCRVELEFIFEDDKYRIVREMTGKNFTASATATVNGKLAANGAEIVTKYIQKKLGMDFKSFFTSIFARQKELNTLSSINASERRPLILRMLGINALDEVVKEVKSDKREKQTLIDKLSSDLLDANGKNKIEIYNQEKVNFEKKKTDIEILIKKSKQKIQVLKKELDSFEKNCKNIKSDYEKIKEKKEELSKKKSHFEEKNKLNDTIKDLEKKIVERKKTIETQKKKIKDYKDVDIDLNKVKERIEKLELKAKDFIKKNEQKKTFKVRLEQDIKDINSKKQKIDKIGPNAKCPTGERVLAEQYKILISNFSKEISLKEKEFDSYSKEIKQIENEKEIILREQNALKKKKNFLENKNRDKQKIETTIDNLEVELVKENIDLNKKQVRLKELESIKFDLKEFEKINIQFDSFYSKYQESLIKRDKKKDELNDVFIELERKTGDVKLVDQRIKDLSEKITEQKKYEQKIKVEKENVQQLSMLSEVMSDFRTYLISRIRPTLSSYSSDFFTRLTDGKYQQIELDEDYNLRIFDDGESYVIDRFSGGEEDLANLCLRLSISEVITERAGGAFNFIILDEIFGSQDMIRRQNIMRALNNLSSKFRQIFLITHVDDVKNYMENIIYINENEDGISSAKIE